jgi:hypothetical protein
VTRATVEDWVPVGSATVTQAGAALSRAIVGDLVTEIRVGDLAEVLISRPDTKPPAPAAAPAPAPPPAPRVDPATLEVLGVFAAQSGQSLDARIAAWDRYLSTHAGSPYEAAIRADVEALQALREQLRPVSAVAAAEPIEAVAHSTPAATQAGTAFPVVFVLDRPEHVASAYLHYRTRDRRTYRRALLVREHDIYLRGTVPAEVVKAPGVEYFVEVSTPNGGTGLALGSPGEPVRVDVKPPPLTDRFGDRDEVGRTTVRIGGEYLDFAALDRRDGDRRDRIASGFVDVSYEIGTAVQRVGVGYGAIVGAGGERDTVWDGGSPLPRAGFHYGRADVELGRPDVAVAVGGIAGVGKEGFGLGVEGRARVGDRYGTNLQVLGRWLPELGFVTDVRFGARPARAVLLGISVGATDQPTRGDVAAKLATELEWIGTPRLSLLIRASWHGRSVVHGGPGGGAAMGFSW